MIPLGYIAVTWRREDMEMVDESRVRSEQAPALADLVWTVGVEAVRITRAETITELVCWEIPDDEVVDAEIVDDDEGLVRCHVCKSPVGTLRVAGSIRTCPVCQGTGLEPR